MVNKRRSQGIRLAKGCGLEVFPFLFRFWSSRKVSEFDKLRNFNLRITSEVFYLRVDKPSIKLCFRLWRRTSISSVIFQGLIDQNLNYPTWGVLWMLLTSLSSFSPSSSPAFWFSLSESYSSTSSSRITIWDVITFNYFFMFQRNIKSIIWSVK